MAEINIERKKRPVWPWILLVVLLALIGWVVYEYVSDRNVVTSQANQPSTETVVYSPAETQMQDMATA